MVEVSWSFLNYLSSLSPTVFPLMESWFLGQGLVNTAYIASAL